MRTLWLILLLTVMAKADESFDRANAAYDAGRFREAAEGYESLLGRDGPRVSVLQNLGSAYHRIGEDGRAILAFERALLIKPNDPDLKANLKLVRDRAAMFPTRRDDAWMRVVDRRSRRDWSLLVLAGGMALPLAAGGWVGLRGRRLRIAMVPVAVVGLGLAGVSFAALRSGEEVESRGIVVGGAATVRISPFATADERGSLTEGREVRLGPTKDGWVRVTVEGGATEGWVDQRKVERVVAGM